MRNHKTPENPPAPAAAKLSRRSLLQGAGLGIASAAFLRGAAKDEAFPHAPQLSAAPPAIPDQAAAPVMPALSAYMSDARTRALPDEVVEKTKQHILDTLAAMISGSALHPGRAALDFARAYGGKEISTVVASDILCGPIEAALT